MAAGHTFNYEFIWELQIFGQFQQSTSFCNTITSAAMLYQKDKSSKCSRELHENSVFPEASEDKNRPAVPFKRPATGQAVCGQLSLAPGERVLIPAWFTTRLSVRACRFCPVSSTCSWRPLSKYYFLLRETYQADPGVSVPFKIDSSCQVDQSLDLGQ